MKLTDHQQTVLIALQCALDRAQEAGVFDLMVDCPAEYHDGLIEHVQGAIAVMEDAPTYCIVRFFRGGSREVTQTGLTLEEAQAHCSDPATQGPGWFDGYEEE